MDGIHAGQGKLAICIQIKNLNDKILVGRKPTSIRGIPSVRCNFKRMAVPAPNVINGVERGEPKMKNSPEISDGTSRPLSEATSNIFALPLPFVIL